MKRYVWNLLIALDQLGNTLLGGYPDETISSRAYKNRHESKLAFYLCKVLDFIDKDHCEEAVEWDEGRKKKK